MLRRERRPYACVSTGRPATGLGLALLVWCPRRLMARTTVYGTKMIAHMTAASARITTIKSTITATYGMARSTAAPKTAATAVHEYQYLMMICPFGSGLECGRRASVTLGHSIRIRRGASGGRRSAHTMSHAPRSDKTSSPAARGEVEVLDRWDELRRDTAPKD